MASAIAAVAIALRMKSRAAASQVATGSATT
jgi:hypothetical protein